MTPEKLYQTIEKSKKHLKFQYSQINCRSIRVDGSNKATPSTTENHPLCVTVSKHGISFQLPHPRSLRTAGHKLIGICIPVEDILMVQACFQRRLPLIVVETSAKFGNYLRGVLGINESSGIGSSNSNHQSIATLFLLDIASDLDPADVGMIKKIFGSLLQELDYNEANKLLMEGNTATAPSVSSGTDANV